MRIVRLPPRANAPARRTRRTNAFAAPMGDKTAMRPFVKLLWTLVTHAGVLFSPLFVCLFPDEILKTAAARVIDL